MKKIASIVFTLAVLAVFVTTASANNCVPLGSYVPNGNNCSPSSLKIFGDGPTGQSVGTTQGLIAGNSFQVGFDNPNLSAADILIVAAFSSNVVGGTLNGISFTSLLRDPFGDPQDGAIHDTLAGLNFPTSPLAYGWLDLGQGVAAGEKLTVNLLSLPAGTILYAESVNNFEVVLSSTEVCVKTNTQGRCTKYETQNTYGTEPRIDHITANSEAAITTQTPEPATLLLLGSGLLGLGLLRRK